MLAILLVLAALAGNVLSTGPSRCDDNVVKEIKASWNGKVPVGLIKNAIANGKEIVVGTTTGYYPDDVRGVFSYFIQEKSKPLTRLDIYQVLKSGILQSKNIHVKEESGSLYDPITKIRRYHIYQDVEGGVTGFYSCLESNDAQKGPPAGAVKIRAFNYNKGSLAKAISLLNKVGVKISTTLRENP